MFKNMNRRDFLKSVGAGSGAAIAAPALLSKTPTAKGAETEPGAAATVYGVLVDTRRCVNCKSCQIACKSWWDNQTDPTTFKTDFTPQTWTYVQEQESGTFDGGDAAPALVKRQCMHCEVPTCVSVCPQNGTAMQKLPNGPVVLNHDNCIRCQMCVNNCPFGVPKFDADENQVRKCVFCYGRVADGRKPACVDTCPTGALQFDTLENIQALAEQAQTDGYPVVSTDPAGNGTSWIYVFEKEREVELTV